jgi:hypothetical protein
VTRHASRPQGGRYGWVGYAIAEVGAEALGGRPAALSTPIFRHFMTPIYPKCLLSRRISPRAPSPRRRSAVTLLRPTIRHPQAVTLSAPLCGNRPPPTALLFAYFSGGIAHASGVTLDMFASISPALPARVQATAPASICRKFPSRRHGAGPRSANDLAGWRFRVKARWSPTYSAPGAPECLWSIPPVRRACTGRWQALRPSPGSRIPVVFSLALADVRRFHAP